MLRTALMLIAFVFLACSGDKPAPTATPAGKANCPMCGSLELPHETNPDVDTAQDTTATEEAEDSGEPSDSTVATIDTTISLFKFDIIFKPDVPQRERELFIEAAQMWEQVVVGDIPDLVFVDTEAEYRRIKDDPSSTVVPSLPVENFLNIHDEGFGWEYIDFSRIRRIDDVLLILEARPDLEYGGLAFTRISRYYPEDDDKLAEYPALGYVWYAADIWERERDYWRSIAPNSLDHLADDFADNTLRQILIHEIGHVLGLCPNADSSSRYSTTGSGRFHGPLAVKAFNALEGAHAVDDRIVPLDPDNRPSTSTFGYSSHWDDMIMPEDIMSYGRVEQQVISTVSVAALADMGYEVDFSQGHPIRIFTDGAPSLGEQGFREDLNPFMTLLNNYFNRGGAAKSVVDGLLTGRRWVCGTGTR